MSFFPSLTLIFLVCSTSADVSVEEPREYFPPQGTTWTYKFDGTDRSFTAIKVDKSKGVTVVQVGELIDTKVLPITKIIVDENKPVGEQPIGVDHFIETPPLKPREIDTRGPGNVPCKIIISLHGLERLKVPAGVFDALRVEERLMLVTDGQQIELTKFTRWYAPNIGLIRECVGTKEVGVLIKYKKIK